MYGTGIRYEDLVGTADAVVTNPATASSRSASPMTRRFCTRRAATSPSTT
jgi:hypothetical protein